MTTDDSRSSAAPGATTALALLLCMNLFNYVDRQVLAGVEPEIRKTYFPDADKSQDAAEYAKRWTGALPFVFMLTYMIFSPIFGVLADRYSRWMLIAIGVSVWSLASGASGLAGTIWILLFTRCFVGIGEAAYGPAAPSIISDLYPVKKRGQVLAWFYAAIPVGSALGYVLGENLAKMSPQGWRNAFYVVVPPGLLLAGLCLFMKEPRRGQVDAAPEGKDTAPKKPKLSWRDYGILARTPSYVLDTAGMTAMTFAIGGIAFWIPAFLEYKKVQPLEGIPPRTVFGGLTVIAGLTATILGGIVGDKLQPRFSGSYFLVSGTAMLLAVPPLLLFVTLPFPLAWIPLSLAVFWLFFNTGPTNTILANVTHPSIRASAFALNIFIIHALGDAISPFLLGWIIGKDRYLLGFSVVAVMVAIGGILWLYGARHLKTDTELAPTRGPGSS